VGPLHRLPLLHGRLPVRAALLQLGGAQVDVATRTAGVVEKCTFCSHRIKQAREEARLDGRELVDDDVRRLPACASACPTNAITFGDLNDPTSRVAELRDSQRVFRLLEHLGTDPNVFYLRRDRKEDE